MSAQESGTCQSTLAAILDELRALRQDQSSALEVGRGRAIRAEFDSLITPTEFAEILAVDGRTLRRMRAAGALPKQVGTTSRPRWRRSDVARYLAGLKGTR